MDAEFLLETALEIGRGNDEDSLTASRGETHMIFTGREKNVAAAAAFLREAAADRMRNYRVEILREWRSGSDAGWKPLGPNLCIPCLAGRIGFALAGSEESYVGDHDVEVAQEAKIFDPVDRACFDGVQAVVAVEPRGKACRLQVAVLESSLLGFRRIGPASPDVGPIRVPKLREVVFRQARLVKPGTTCVLGEGPARRVEGKRLSRTRISVRVTEVF